MSVFTNLHITVMQNYGVVTTTVPSIMGSWKCCEECSLCKCSFYWNIK